MNKFAVLRITLLLVALVVLSFITAHQWVYSRNWTQTLPVTVYPINGDNHPLTQRYIDSLKVSDFQSIERWGIREAKRHRLSLTQPFTVELGETLTALPPVLSAQRTAMSTLWWGLKFRFWAWKNTPDHDQLTRVRMYVVYQRGQENEALPHSLGLQKGLIGLVYAFSIPEQTLQNNIVIAHELLHTVGARDKYNASGDPQKTIGFANPEQKPLYPQRFAEIMAGRKALAEGKSTMADSLRHVKINPYTAREINWIH